jgi:hypothetical protein
MRNFERFGAAALFFFIGAAASAQLNFIGPTDRPQTGSEPTRVASGDVNNDGDPDVVCTNRLSNTVSIFLGDGQGGLTFSQNRTVGTGPLGIVCVDVNADGDRDIVTANRTGNSISVLLGNGNGTFQTATTIAVGSGTNPREIATADMNGDGARDVILVLEGSNSAQIRYNNGAGGFGSANVTLPVPANPSNLRITDIDSDGDRDIFVTLNAGVGGVRLYRNNGSGAFPSSLQSTISWPGATYVQGIGIADFDADGHQDLVLAQNFFSPEPETGRFDGGLGAFLRGRGKLQFEAVPAAASGLVMPEDAKALVLLDVDGNGTPDFVATTNDGPVRTFANARQLTGVGVRGALCVQLRGAPGNPAAIGARVELLAPDGGSTGLQELAAGSGYLSQSVPAAWFGKVPVGARLRVRWPDGAVVEHRLERTTGAVTVAR